MNTTEHPHHIAAILDHDGTVMPEVTCTAPEGAACRLHCGICEDTWDDNHETHKMVDQGFCLATEGWFDDWSEIFEMYQGPRTHLQEAPIDIRYDGDAMVWSYAATNEAAL